MKRCLLLAVAWVCVALLGGCGSSPQVDYFLLTADAAPSSDRGGPTIGIATLEVAEYLHRMELVSFAGSNRLRVDPYRRWAEPLEDGIRRALALNLSAQLGSDGVRSMPWPLDWVPQWLLRCSIVRLDVRDEAVELIAVWSLQDGGRARAADEHTSRLTRARSAAGGEAIAADISAMLLDLGREISSAIESETR
jgi:uncharacterized lipoprotein YmbA